MEALFRYHGITVDINHKLKPNAKTKLTRAEINRLQIQYDKLLAEREEALKAIP
ncbi:putative deoxycytidine triphosphate deaminase [Pseudomonas phage PhiPizzaParty]|uniref:PHIKZ217 n=6 Tax=Viruses TaxID=10239 RepID=Q8SCU5_BPDPK|nr:PHIKZ217 [Pseudomonas phage phiKZ]AAL83118.2 PHIKZ217 [Pseudomonas phage phiKZ]WNV50253.1 putative deoxycytidine triphosphate deaminase [Pseudomonas phage PhiPizzaParty]